MSSQRTILHKVCVALTLLIVGFIHVARSEMFTALADVERILHVEKDIANDLREYIASEEARLEKIRKVADDYESHSNEGLSDIVHHVGHPVNAFLLVKRFTLDWKNVEDLLKNDTSQEIINRINGHQERFPDTEDLGGAATALLRLQDTYEIPTSKLALGEVGKKKSSPMTANDCFELGKSAYLNGDHYHCILWMDEAIDIYENERNKTVDKATVLDYLSYSLYLQGNVRHALVLTNELISLGNVRPALKLTNEWLLLVPDHERASNNKKYYESLIEKEESEPGKRGDSGEKVKNERPTDEYKRSTEFIVYEKLCRGEDTHEIPSPHTLACSYNDNNSPFLKLQPIKQEVVFHDPRIVILHDVMSDSEIEVIKTLAAPRLQRATARNIVTGKFEPAHYRISKRGSPRIYTTVGDNGFRCTPGGSPFNVVKLARSTVFDPKKKNTQGASANVQSYRTSKGMWLDNFDHHVVDRVDRRVHAFTGFDSETTEQLQVVNYGIGGHYEPHFDYARNTPAEKHTFEEFRGNRIATVLFYMTDVELGGATVFPTIGAKVFPKKGTAVFWHNLHKSGEGDELTRHAACPVLVGSKWVSNKWIHERGQEFRRPCGLSADE
ncbi:unnamed protein product [Owenia fusiformis]|uniref:procollagen-proline 4-dioxygenase n=1 Tax=Owenia fusiformis TaxID=6347 RepID=A0A8S4PSM8_OWEFU|nr:unnamed protein product [Owenia fusiformis]